MDPKRRRLTVIAAGSLVGVVAIAAASTVMIAHGDTHKSSAANAAQHIATNAQKTASTSNTAGSASGDDSTDQQGSRAYLGVTLADNSGKLTVQSVVSGGPAATAGVNQGDVITAVDGTTVASTADLRKALAAKKSGDTVTLSVDRSGNKQDIKVTLGSLPQRQNAPANAGPSHGFLGVSIQNVDDAAKQKYNLTTSDGALITDAQSGGPAANAGLKAGDLITSVNGTAIKNASDLTNALQNTKSGDSATIQYQRAGASQSATVKLGDSTAAGNGAPGFNRRGNGNGPSIPNVPNIGSAISQNFDRFISRETKTKDANGTVHTDTTVAGTVKSAPANNQVTVTLNGGGDQTFTIDGNTKLRKGLRGSASASDLAAGDKVMVTTRDGSNTATSIMAFDPNGASNFFNSILGGDENDGSDANNSGSSGSPSGGSANSSSGNGGFQIAPSDGGFHIRIPGGGDITVPVPGRGGSTNSNGGGGTF